MSGVPGIEFLFRRPAPSALFTPAVLLIALVDAAWRALLGH